MNNIDKKLWKKTAPKRHIIAVVLRPKIFIQISAIIHLIDKIKTDSKSSRISASTSIKNNYIGQELAFLELAYQRKTGEALYMTQYFYKNFRDWTLDTEKVNRFEILTNFPFYEFHKHQNRPRNGISRASLPTEKLATIIIIYDQKLKKTSTAPSCNGNHCQHKNNHFENHWWTSLAN